MNRLASETSLYLRQHASNPVDWFPWGPEAIDRSRAEDKPIFLSVGYSACHWCHVMEHESFEDAATAELLNQHFVCVKVDREERPDLDQLYMTAHQLLTREGGGWPLSVFLTPDRTPFYAGTYFPPDDRYAPHRPSFKKLLMAITDAWANKRAELVGLGTQVADALAGMQEAGSSDNELSPGLLDHATTALKRIADRTHGGFGGAPKFPHPLELRVLLRAAARGDADALFVATLSLEKMARGGLCDQVGGGFARYSVDARWLVPHFEKMLYDNALLPPAYVEVWQLTGDDFYKQVACETLDWVLAEMTALGGGFFSTLDADSEGHEGKFTIWDFDELGAVLGDDADFARSVFGVVPGGNFEGQSILFRSKSDEQDARLQRMELPAFRDRLKRVKATLYAHRAKRVWPGRDEKVLTAWNALMVSAMAHAGAAFGEPKYVTAATRAADFLLTHHRTAAGRLYRTSGDGQPAKLNGYLEDYAYLCDALVTLYEATFEPRWLTAAGELADTLVKHFADPAGGGFFFTADDHEKLLARAKDLHDGAVPAGNAVAATAFLRLAALTGRNDLRERAVGVLKAYRDTVAEQPAAAGQMLVALELHLSGIEEVAVVGPADHPETVALLAAARRVFRPNRVLAHGDPAVPLLAGKPVRDGRPTVYVCRDFACREPRVGEAALAAVAGARIIPG